jgi:hypothetical protein
MANAHQIRAPQTIYPNDVPMNCAYCHRPLISIDYYVERLVGCTEENLKVMSAWRAIHHCELHLIVRYEPIGVNSCASQNVVNDNLPEAGKSIAW